MHIHILGICGTFMGGLALLARALGHRVTGSDANVYPPMSTQLEEAGIQLVEGYDPAQLKPAPDCVVVSNSMSRGNPCVEYMLDNGLRYQSGPAWLAENLLRHRWVIGVAGTHGKTTTSAMIAWILEQAGLEPGFLIGGVPLNFGVSARLGADPFFVVEADEYDTAFFDKRSKFIHYQPRTLVLNNLEFDHADIFDDLAMIQRQFHHLVRTIPGNGRLIVQRQDANLAQVLEQGCWSEIEYIDDAAAWHARDQQPDQRQFTVCHGRQDCGQVSWSLMGVHNRSNALAAIAAARHAGVPARIASEYLGGFRSVKRRMELRGEAAGIRIYDDFAHHPTAIRTTLSGLRASVGDTPILVLLELRSNTMRTGVHAPALPQALAEADRVILLAPEELGWDPLLAFEQQDLGQRVYAEPSVDRVVARCVELSKSGNLVLVMSNGGFGGIHERLLLALSERAHGE